MFPGRPARKLVEEIIKKTETEKLVWHSEEIKKTEGVDGFVIRFATSYNGLTLRVSKILDNIWIGQHNYQLEISNGKNTVTLGEEWSIGSPICTLFYLVSGPSKQEREKSEKEWRHEQADKERLLVQFTKALK